MSEEGERTCYVGSLSSKVTQELLEELFTQVGPIEKVVLKDSDSRRFALVQFSDEESVPFAIETMSGVELFNTPIVVKPRNGTQQEVQYKMYLEKKRKNDSNLSQSYTPPSVDDRKRNHMGLKPVRENNWRQSNWSGTNRQQSFPPPPPPPDSYNYRQPAMPHSEFRTPPMPMARNFQAGSYTPSSMPRLSREHHDNWHTPPSNRSLNNSYGEGSHRSFPNKDDSGRNPRSYSQDRNYRR